MLGSKKELLWSTGSLVSSSLRLSSLVHFRTMPELTQSPSIQ
jgi:hypothetical protein